MIDVEHIAVQLGGRAVLHDVSLHAKRGEMLGVVGPNGCGKSTLLRCMAGLSRPGSGDVRIDGRAVHAMRPIEIARSIAFQAQEPTGALGYSVRSVVEMGRLPHRRMLGAEDARDEELVERSMRCMGVHELADRAVETLSGGERQRVAIARALAQDTPALILDEPTNHLDVHHQFALLDLLREFVDNGLCIVVTLHDLRLASRVCDRLVVLHQGGVAAEGPPMEALTPSTISRVYRVGATVAAQQGTRELDIRLFPFADPVHGLDGFSRKVPT